MLQFTHTRQALIDSVAMVHPEDSYAGEEYAEIASVQAARFIGKHFAEKWQTGGVDLSDPGQVYAAAQAEIAAISPCPNEGCGSNRVVLTTCPNNLMPFGDFAAPGSFCRNCDVPHQ